MGVEEALDALRAGAAGTGRFGAEEPEPASSGVRADVP